MISSSRMIMRRQGLLIEFNLGFKLAAIKCSKATHPKFRQIGLAINWCILAFTYIFMFVFINTSVIIGN